MGRVGSGIEARDSSIRIHFTYQGQQRKETLKTDGKPMAPTPANLKYAHRLAAEIKDKIRHGSFVYADYFPASPTATTGQGVTVADRLDLWLKLQSGKAGSTVKGYRTAVNWWTAKIGAKPVRALVHSDILTALTSEADWSGKTANNKSSVLRLALKLAVRDGVIKTSPIEGLESASHQAPEPDPFTLEEAQAIIAGLHQHYDPQIARYFAFKFYTGCRTSESLALRWENVDWRRKTITVRDAIVLGEYNRRTKTSTVRHIELNSVALEVLKAQKAATFLQPHGWIFPDPRTGERFSDDEPPRELWWRPCLKRLGIRYRSPYDTRHTYATMMLMAGVTPAFAARQMGHSVQMFLDTYSKWIDGGQNAVEMGKLEGLLKPASSPALPRPSAKSR
jgi:integrase